MPPGAMAPPPGGAVGPVWTPMEAYSFAWKLVTKRFGAVSVPLVVGFLVLYAIMIAGSIWEKAVFGRYLFAPAFFWEDAVSMIVLALHTAYLAALWLDWLDGHSLMLLALAAYATYVVNAAQFILKLREARLAGEASQMPELAR